MLTRSGIDPLEVQRDDYSTPAYDVELPTLPPQPTAIDPHDLQALFDPRTALPRPASQPQDLSCYPSAAPARAPQPSRPWQLQQYQQHKTMQAVAVMCLNPGITPPDVTRVEPHPNLVCWSSADAMEYMTQGQLQQLMSTSIGTQYQRVHSNPGLKCKVLVDPHEGALQKACQDARNASAPTPRNPHQQRTLFHYTGYGAPRPTKIGEIWVFNKEHTQYTPLHLDNLPIWLGEPAIYVFDCPSAARVIPFLTASGGGVAGDLREPPTAPFTQRTIVLAACQDNEDPPKNVNLPADAFTSILTTPTLFILRHYALLNPRDFHPNILSYIDACYRRGHPTDRTTPLGDLNCVLMSITDAIAWETVPRCLFQDLFRGDQHVATLLRNFLLASHVLCREGVTPASHPALPPTHCHPLWQELEQHVRTFLRQLPSVFPQPGDPGYEHLATPEPLAADPLDDLASSLEALRRHQEHLLTAIPPRLDLYTPSSHFRGHLDELHAFIANPPVGVATPRPPRQLPVLAQALMALCHRSEALLLLARFVDLGPWAVDAALSTGIHTCLLSNLRNPRPNTHAATVHILSRMLATEPALRTLVIYTSSRMVRALAAAPPPRGPPQQPPHSFLLRLLDPSNAPDLHATAAFSLATLAHSSPVGQELLAHPVPLADAPAFATSVLTLLVAAHQDPPTSAGQPRACYLLRLQTLLAAAGGFMADQPIHALRLEPTTGVSLSGILRSSLLAHPLPTVRAAAVYALGCSIFSLVPGTALATTRQAALQDALAAGDRPLDEHYHVELAAAELLCDLLADACPSVRAELAVALARFVSGHMAGVLAVVALAQAPPRTPPRRAHRGLPASPPSSPPGPQACPPPVAEDFATHRQVLVTLLALSSDPEPAVAAAARQALSLAGLQPPPCPTPIPSPVDLAFSPPPGHPSLALAPAGLPRPLASRGPMLPLSALPSHPPGMPESPFYTQLVALFARPLFQPVASAWLDFQTCRLPPPAPTARAAASRMADPAPVAFDTSAAESDSYSFEAPAAPPSDAAAPACSALGACILSHSAAAGPKQLLRTSIPSPLLSSAPAFHPTDPVLLLAPHPTTLHALHLTLDAPRTPTSLLAPPANPTRRLTRTTTLSTTLPGPSPTLLACGTDGTAYLYRLSPSGTPALLTAWNALPAALTHSPLMHRPALFAHHPHTPTLHATGGPHSFAITCWDLTTQQLACNLPLSHPPATILAPHTSPPLLLSAAADQAVRIFDTRTPCAASQAFLLPPPTASATVLSVLPAPCHRDPLVAISRADGTIEIHDTRYTRQCPPAAPPATFQAHPPGTACGMANAAGLLCTASDSDGAVKLWDLWAGAAAAVAVHIFVVGSRGVRTLVADPLKPRIAAVATEGTVAVWEM